MYPHLKSTRSSRERGHGNGDTWRGTTGGHRGFLIGRRKEVQGYRETIEFEMRLHQGPVQTSSKGPGERTHKYEIVTIRRGGGGGEGCRE